MKANNIRGTFGAALGTVTQTAELITDSVGLAHGFVSRHRQLQDFLGAQRLEVSKAEGTLACHQRLEMVGKAYATLDSVAIELAKKLVS